MAMVHEYMVNAYREGKIDDIRSYDLKFNQWVWNSIGRLFPRESVVQPIDVGITKDACFWKDGYKVDVRFVGYRLGEFKAGFYDKEWRRPIYYKVEIEPSEYVFCIDQINDLSREEQVLDVLENLMDYSTKYIILTAWAYDIQVPAETQTRKRFYWDIEKYMNRLEKKGFRLAVKAVYNDAINILYIFKRRF